MPCSLHHLSVFITDMDRSIYLFRNILGFELAWRLPRVGGGKLSAILGIPDMEAELAYLTRKEDAVGIELARLISPARAAMPLRFGDMGTTGLSLTVVDLAGLHQRLTREGWRPLTPCTDIRTPGGNPARVFCFHMAEGVMVELIEETPFFAEDKTTESTGPSGKEAPYRSDGGK